MGTIITAMLEVLAVAVCAYIAGYQRALAARYKEEQYENDQLETVWQRVYNLPADSVRECLQPTEREK